ncbi:MAG: DUF790 family protein, partial [Rubrobacteraceae bacterium]
MLRSEHVMARLSRGRVIPHSLSERDESAIEAASEIRELYADHVGKTRAELGSKLTAKEEELGP